MDPTRRHFLLARAIALLVVLTTVWSTSRLAADPAPFPGQPAQSAPDDLDSQQRELEAQRQEIDRKLAAIAQKRLHRNTLTRPAAPPTATADSTVTTATSKPTAESGKALSNPAQASVPAATAPMPASPDWFNAHGQATVITQKHDAFHAPYAGRLSLERVEPIRTSVTATLFLGLRLPWPGGEVYLDPEIAGGEGFSGVTGIAGFPNGEIPRVGTPEPEPYVARLFYRQSFGFGGESEKLEDGPNQLAGARDVSRVTVTLGKFAADDFFQQTAYANDPRGQFENWALFTAGAWDYPADTRGYTEGGVVELNTPNWSLRYGAMAEPKTANGGTFDSRVLDTLAQSLEVEQRWTIGSHAGSAKLMGFLNRSNAGKYRQAIDDPPIGQAPNVTLTRTFRGKYGVSFTADQELTDDLSFFTRLSWNDGHSESWAFTEIDRSATLGLALKGTRWQRPEDVVGLAGTINGLAKDHRDYLGAGGLGFLIGDGRLPHYAPEEALEAYYDAKLAEHIFVTPDFQLINHPAYNSDRGPVFVGGIRAHVEF